MKSAVAGHKRKLHSPLFSIESSSEDAYLNLRNVAPVDEEPQFAENGDTEKLNRDNPINRSIATRRFLRLRYQSGI